MSGRISVIMGIYNCADTLPEAIDSLMNQTYNDWKLIMCNDGSTDNTFQIAEKLKSEFPDRILLISNDKNMGLNYTLNHCLKYADGEYIARMDGDDVSLPTRFEKEIAFLDSHPEYAIVSSSMIYFDEDGDWGIGSAKERPQIKDIAKGTPFCHAPCMVRREAYEAVGGYTVDKKLLRVEDYHLWIKMLEKGYRGCNISEPLYKMRDDRAAMQRRAFKYRINEAYVRHIAISHFKLPKTNYIFVFRPLLVGLLPRFIYQYIHKRRMKS